MYTAIMTLYGYNDITRDRNINTKQIIRQIQIFTKIYNII